MKKIILFDIDGTLIDSSDKLGPLSYQSIADQASVDIQTVLNAKDKYKLTLEKNTDYYPKDLLCFVCDEIGVETKKISDPFINKNFYEKSLFPEIKLVLDKLSRKYNLGIFSEGFEDYQSKKITLSGLIEYFDKKWIFIERRKLSPEALAKIPVGSTIIDDKKEVIGTLKNLRPDLDLAWINRKNEEKIEGIRTMKSLEELL